MPCERARHTRTAIALGLLALVGGRQAETLPIRTHPSPAPRNGVERIPLRPKARELRIARSVPALRLLGRSVTTFRLLTRDVSRQRLLGEYLFDHTPTQRE